MRLDITVLLGAFFGFMNWGIYGCLFFATIYLTRKQGLTRMRSPVMIALILLYVFNFVYSISSLIILTTMYRDKETPPLVSEPVYNAAFMLNDAMSLYCTILADALLTWRLYVVWLRDWRSLILPAMALTCMTGVSTGIIVMDITWIQKHIESQLPSYQKLNMAVILTTLPFNIIVTAMIVGRLWWANRRLSKATGAPAAKDYVNVMVALVESGALYSITLTAYIIINEVGNGAGAYLFTASLPRITGIVPTLICLKRALGYWLPSETATMGTVTGGGNVISRIELGSTHRVTPRPVQSRGSLDDSLRTEKAPIALQSLGSLQDTVDSRKRPVALQSLGSLNDSMKGGDHHV